MFSSPFKKPALLLAVIIGLALSMFTAGILWKWPLGIQLIALFRFVKWTCTAIYAGIPIFVLGHWLSQHVLRFSSQKSLTWRVLIDWAMGWALVIVLGILLLALGVYSVWIWMGLALLLNLAFVAWLAMKRWQPIVHFWKNILPELQNDFVGEITGSAKIWNVLLLSLLFLAFLQALLPPNVTDELSYHLVIPRLWGLQHHWWMNTDNYHLLFPANIEIVWGYALAIGGIHIPRLMTLIFGILTIGGMRRWIKDLGFNSWICGISLCFFVITPLTAVMLPINYVEWPLFLWIFLGWWASQQYVNTGNRAYAGVTAITWGMCIGTKYTALPIIALLGLEWLIHISRRFSRRHSFVALLVLLAGSFIFAGPWFARNVVLKNDPFYPLGQTFSFQSQHRITSSEELNVHYLTNVEKLNGFWRWNQWFYYATISRTFDYRMHFGWPLLHYMVLLLGWKYWRDKPWLPVVLLSGLFFYFTPAARIFFPLMGLTWMFLPHYLQFVSYRQILRLIISGIMLLLVIPSMMMIFYFWFMTYNRASQDYLMGLMNENSLLKKDEVITPIMEWFWGTTPKDSRIWVWCEDDVFYFDRWVRPSSPYDPPAFLNIIKTSGIQGLSEEIKKDRIDYVVLDTTKCSPPFKTVKTETMSLNVSEHLQQQLFIWMKLYLKPVIKDYRFDVYEVITHNT